MTRLFPLLLCALHLSSSYVLADTTGIPEPRPSFGETKDTEQPKDEIGDEKKKPNDGRIYQAACPAIMEGLAKATIAPPIKEGQCGTVSPLAVTAIRGVPVSSGVVLNCRMVTALAQWLPQVQQAARKHLGVGIASLSTSTSYQCRRRNNQPDGKISEHGFANALDIVGVKLTSGESVSVEKDWVVQADLSSEEQKEGTAEQTPKSRFLRAIHGEACKVFTTVLGPEADVYHETHFHFDLGCHGKTCTYRICQ